MADEVVGIVEIRPGSRGEAMGLLPGDILVRCNDEVIGSDLNFFLDLMNRSSKFIPLDIVRGTTHLRILAKRGALGVKFEVIQSEDIREEKSTIIQIIKNKEQSSEDYKEYEILLHDEKESVVVDIGFSWKSALTQVLWSVQYRLWLISISASLIYLVAITVGMEYFLITYPVMAFYFGRYSSSILRKSLASQGYKSAGVFHLADAEDAANQINFLENPVVDEMSETSDLTSTESGDDINSHPHDTPFPTNEVEEGDIDLVADNEKSTAR